MPRVELKIDCVRFSNKLTVLVAFKRATGEKLVIKQLLMNFIITTNRVCNNCDKNVRR